MVQAARSGRQNIAEGSRASATSSQTELRLVSVARASLDELLLDYEDFLRQRGLRQWSKDDSEARAVREVGKRHGSEPSTASERSHAYSDWLTQANPAVVANTLLCLIHQTNYLLDRQIAALERQFVREGGYSERLAAARLEQRRASDSTDLSDRSDLPGCPLCGAVMVVRTARRGKRAGSQFLGCSRYPDCMGTERLDGPVSCGGSR